MEAVLTAIEHAQHSAQKDEQATAWRKDHKNMTMEELAQQHRELNG